MGKVLKYWLAHPYQNYPRYTPHPEVGGGGGWGLFKRLHITIQIVAGDTSFTRMIMSKQDYIYLFETNFHLNRHIAVVSSILW